jgi:MFS family permease
MGWTTMGLSLGNNTGPLLGGILYKHAGHYATFSMAFGVIALDVVLRCLLRKTRRRELPASPEPQLKANTPVQSERPEQGTDFQPSSNEQGGKQQAPPAPSEHEHEPATQEAETLRPTARPFAIFTILKNPDILCSLWSVFLITVVLTGLEAVSVTISQ